MGGQEYEIVIVGRLRDDWSDWLEGFRICGLEDDATLLRGEVVDSAALYGLVAKLRDLNLTIISIRQAGPGSAPPRGAA